MTEVGSVTAEDEAAEAAVDLPRRLVAEGLGTAFLLAIVVGSGIPLMSLKPRSTTTPASAAG